MAENQFIEYKESWRDEYLKWIAGFANAQGGTLLIGVNDKGQVVGLDNAKRLLEDLPNKIQNALGIIADVNLREQAGQAYIEIVTQPYEMPVAYHGEYHLRSGSTKQVLKGNALQQFLLKRLGKTFDDVVEPNVRLEDLDPEAIQAFGQRVMERQRLDQHEPLQIGLSTFLDNLNLTDGEGGLKRAALILFGKHPMRFILGAHIKIGRFGQDATDLKFQDELSGDGFRLAERTLQLLDSKYLPGLVSYQGLYRQERLPYPPDAIREALLNAIMHKDYFGGPIFVWVYDDRLVFFNDGSLIEGLTLDDLQQPHSSRRRNPTLAMAMFRGGLVETWGRGTLKMIAECRAWGLPDPLFEDKQGGFWVTFFADRYQEVLLRQAGLNERQMKGVLYAKQQGRITNADYQRLNDCSRNTASADLKGLVQQNWLKHQGTKGAGSYYVIRQ
ncbi:ATP-binding protein [Spirosoma endbachense]|uniref:Transcriptional regulator n=1 Tax=Spirosoma endbachense TaxID=2666025 RepID=A0A6P1W979_9BACT|nr:ATP-binding protein [Spirosoma endbachense]QHW00257.1 transcriptional regulator [Spirosoma endbachense]